MTGGGSGTTTGIHIQMDTGNIELVRQTVDQAIQQDVDKAVRLLEDLANEISGNRDKGTIRNIVEALRKTVLTPALQAAVFAIVQATLGKL